MLMDVKGVTYSIHYLTEFTPSRPTLVCLHGFTGTSATFDCLNEARLSHNLIAIDLIGHGDTSVFVHPYRYTTASQLSDLDWIISALNLEKIDLLGYSMGGRLALSYAVKHPTKINQLILESSSPGLSGYDERKKRRMSDNRLACLLTDKGIHHFVDFWENIPLFATQKKLSTSTQETIRNERLSQNPYGLAMSLRYFGTGIQPPLWDKLSLLNGVPVALLVGEYDKKFVSLANQMVEKISRGHVITFSKSGHCIHLEKPNEFAETIRDILISEGP
ncbi:2-succinyl-6-hydroxy-2,4-cyclohexadiene-1-carboxylate synthase [Vagococcus bubulae]|uniref:Putative 2-succinyl-6-hydroxy-2,4-cyclohexadiene-1-carboxylate synthase n=1 Tax=Vagococcus bubulae TaxID=1977868 RepID=A0A429ZPJ8_9ENTE|nr:2-succinyl-6-hydroxy-2,4-cyclohexadiene-1-carboxylate synthase [Vagococcus bubulae]RST95640.1 2-succinyl-6-hydroxy-2,4-cyclohexadiene-1-carboxylate synthase [Vagococcus bubulae]